MFLGSARTKTLQHVRKKNNNNQFTLPYYIYRHHSMMISYFLWESSESKELFPEEKANQDITSHSYSVF